MDKRSFSVHRGIVFAIFALIILFGIIVIPGCGGGGNVLPPDNGNNSSNNSNNGSNSNGSSGNGSGNGINTSDIETSKRAKVIASDSNIEISTTENNELELSGSDIPEIHPGHILVSAKNGGLLVRVKKVTRQDGKVILETSPAALTDLISNGKIEISQQFKMTDGKLVENKSAKRRNAKFAFEDGALKFSGQELDLGDKATIKITDGSFKFDPDFDFVLDVDDFKVKEFKCSATGAVDINLDAEVELKAITDRLEKDVTIGEITFPEPAGIIMLGDIPVVYEFFMKVKLGAGLSAGNIGTVDAGYDLSASVTAGAQYLDHKWGPISEFNFDINPHLPTITIHPVSVEVYAKPEFGMKFYKVVGPSISYKDYFKLCGDYHHGHFGAELRKGQSVDLNFTFEIVDPITFKYTHNLIDKSAVLLARLEFDKEPANLGDISWEPSGISGTNFYWTTEGDHYKKVTVTGEPEEGYETGGFTIQNLCSWGRGTAKRGEQVEEEINASKLITAHFVPEGEGDNWDGSGTTNRVGPWKINVEVLPKGAGQVILFPTKDGYFHNENVIAQVKPADGFVFHHWEGNALSKMLYDPIIKFAVPDNSCTLRVVLASDPPRTLRVPNDYATIQDAIDAATYNDIIELSAGTYSGNGNRELDFENKDLTIRGQGCDSTIIDLGGSEGNPHRLAILGLTEDDYLPNTIKLEKLTIKNGYAEGSFPANCGGVFAMSSPHIVVPISRARTSLDISHCCFENCKAEEQGGVIWIDSVDDPGVSINIIDTKFKNCSDAIYIKQTNTNSISVEIDSCTFDSNNSAISIPYVSTVTLTNSTFTNNNGGCTFDGDIGKGLTIENCTFTGNHSHAIAYDGRNATTYAEISQCTFTNNDAKNGGAMRIWGKVNVTNCQFESNSATESDGGAVDIKGGCIMHNCTFTNNQSHSYGGAACIGENSSIVDSTFTGNSGDSGGAVELTQGGQVGDSTFENNTADLWGGAIVITNYGGTASGCTIKNNTAAQGGGAISADSGIIRNCSIEGNKAINDYGGGIIAYHAEIYNCTIKNNTSENSHSGGVNLTDTIIAGCEVTGNKATNGEGGGIAGRDSTITDCTITNNQASEGGGIYCWGDMDIFGDTITGNTPNDKAGCD